MRILGLDLSLTSTGYCVLEDDRVAWHGSVSPQSRDIARLAEFDHWIRYDMDLRSGFHPSVDQVAIEGYSFGSISHHHAIGELGGVIKLAIRDADVPLTVIPPATWKKQLLGKGNLQKDQVRLEAFKRYGVEFPSQDTLDAWAVAMCLRRQLLGLDKPQPKEPRRRPANPSQQELLHDQARTPTSVRAARAAQA